MVGCNVFPRNDGNKNSADEKIAKHATQTRTSVEFHHRWNWHFLAVFSANHISYQKLSYHVKELAGPGRAGPGRLNIIIEARAKMWTKHDTHSQLASASQVR